MCDVDATIYLPRLEETGYMPTEKYVQAREILAHSRTRQQQEHKEKDWNQAEQDQDPPGNRNAMAAGNRSAQ